MLTVHDCGRLVRSLADGEEGGGGGEGGEAREDEWI